MAQGVLDGRLSLRDSLTHVSRELYHAYPELAVELVIVRHQADMRSFQMPFQQLARRIDAPDIIALSALG